MAMTYAGAAGTTREEMAAALRLPGDESVAHSGFAALQRRMDPADTTAAYRLDIANRLWGQAGYRFVDVNEKGTEAAAATAVVGVQRGSRPRIETFRADHPFLFLIRDARTESILFLGRVTDPSIAAG